jgi:hypothetical protein
VQFAEHRARRRPILGQFIGLHTWVGVREERGVKDGVFERSLAIQPLGGLLDEIESFSEIAYRGQKKVQ